MPLFYSLTVALKQLYTPVDGQQSNVHQYHLSSTVPPLCSLFHAHRDNYTLMSMASRDLPFLCSHPFIETVLHTYQWPEERCTSVPPICSLFHAHRNNYTHLSWPPEQCTSVPPLCSSVPPLCSLFQAHWYNPTLMSMASGYVPFLCPHHCIDTIVHTFWCPVDMSLFWALTVASKQFYTPVDGQ
jgi:hypothetical protein